MMTTTGEEVIKMDSQQEQSAWRQVKYKERFQNAFRGVHVVVKATRHIWIHFASAVAVVVCGFYFKISSLEWIAVVFAIGFVFMAEAVNTAIEIDIDLTSPEYHPFARDTKDVAAAAVILAVITAGIIGLIIFLPKFLSLLK
jgi:diacylglycerol kinase